MFERFNKWISEARVTPDKELTIFFPEPTVVPIEEDRTQTDVLRRLDALDEQTMGAVHQEVYQRFVNESVADRESLHRADNKFAEQIATLKGTMAEVARLVDAPKVVVENTSPIIWGTFWGFSFVIVTLTILGGLWFLGVL
jgi:hypothetical protein